MSISKQRLDKLLIERGFVKSRNKAIALILAGKVKVDGKVVAKAGTQVNVASQLEIIQQDKWVSRGAYKLLKALDCFDVDPKDAICFDVGASTGGFTQVLLERGAKKVYAIDVGYGQLAWTLRQDKRVIVREKTNARYLSKEDFDEEADLIVVDVSFISLKLIIPVLAKLLSARGDILALIKPQFEIGRKYVGRGGVVADPLLHEKVLKDVVCYVTNIPPLNVVGLTHSPIKGPKGNIEFLLHATAKPKDPLPLNFMEVVNAAHFELT